MTLKRLELREIDIGSQLETVPGMKVFIPSRRKQEPPPPPPTYNEEQLKAAEREGFKKGFVAGEREGHQKAQNEQSDVDRTLTGMQERFVKAIAPVFEQYRQMVIQAQKDIPALALSIAKKVAVDALQDNAQAVINEISLRACETMVNEPELTIVVHESVADTLENKLQEISQRLSAATKIVIVCDPVIPPADCRIEWQNGALERVTAQLWQQVEKVVGNMQVVSGREAAAQMEILQQQVDSNNNQTPSTEKE